MVSAEIFIQHAKLKCTDSLSTQINSFSYISVYCGTSNEYPHNMLSQEIRKNDWLLIKKKKMPYLQLWCLVKISAGDILKYFHYFFDRKLRVWCFFENEMQGWKIPLICLPWGMPLGIGWVKIQGFFLFFSFKDSKFVPGKYSCVQTMTR